MLGWVPTTKKSKQNCLPLWSATSGRFGIWSRSVSDLKQFLEAMRECTDIRELTHTLVNTLIKHIEIHDSIKNENGVKHVPLDVYFTTVGISNVPDTEGILQIMEEICTKPLRIA